MSGTPCPRCDGTGRRLGCEDPKCCPSNGFPCGACEGTGEDATEGGGAS